VSDGLRICRLVDSYPMQGRASFGLQPVFFNLSRAQARRGHDVQVIAKRHAGEPREETHQGVVIHRVNPPMNSNAYLLLRRLSAETKSVVHTHATTGVFMALLRKTVNSPLVSQVHGTTFSAATPLELTFNHARLGYSRWGVTMSYIRERSLWSAADRVAAVSSSVRSDLMSRYDIRGDKIRLVFNGVDVEVFRRVEEPSLPGLDLKGRKIVLYVGHFGLRKGVIHLIKAMQGVVHEVPDSALVCIGGVPPWMRDLPFWDYLRQEIRRDNLEDRVFLVDRIPNEKLPEYYSSASVFVLPSYYEAFPKVLIEAMACETPVVTSRMGGTVDSVRDGENGYFVQYGRPEQIAEAIVRILKDERLGRRMGEKGRELVLREFTWEKVATRMDSIYAELLPRQDLPQSPVLDPVALGGPGSG